jgi:hypothetical protein
LIEQTARLAGAMLLANDDATSYTQLFAALQLRRVIEAVAAIANDLSLPRILAELLDGTLSSPIRR